MRTQGAEVRNVGRLALVSILALAMAGCTGPSSDEDASEIGAGPNRASPTFGSSSETPVVGAPHGTSPSPKLGRFGSVAKAMAFIQARVGVKVTLPVGLGGNVSLSPDHPVYKVPGAGYYLWLEREPDSMIGIQYGGALFDGCGADMAKVTSVGDAPALYMTRGRHGTTLIWPATPDRTEGDFGLDTPYSLKKTIRLAESMQERGGRGSMAGC